MNENIISEILNNWFFNHPINKHDYGDLVGEFVVILRENNPLFDEDKFIENCGLKEDIKCFVCNEPAEHKKMGKDLCTYHYDLANDHKRDRD